jgi:small subunit ribosomal protein S2
MMSPRDAIRVDKEHVKLLKVFKGVKEMDNLPGVVYVVDVNKEITAVREARRLQIPIVAITDTNVDPELIDLPIPGNDDSLRSIELISKIVADAVIEGRKGFEDTPETAPVDKEGASGS